MASTQTLNKAVLVVLLGASGFFYYQASKLEQQLSVFKEDLKNIEAQISNLTAARSTQSSPQSDQVDYQGKLASLEKEIKSLQDQLLINKNIAEYQVRKTVNDNSAYPPCWKSAKGKARSYIIKVTFTSPDKVIVTPAWPDISYLPLVEAVPPIMKMIKKKALTIDEFEGLASEVVRKYVNRGTADECRYSVILNNSVIKDKSKIDYSFLNVSQFFYTVESNK